MFAELVAVVAASQSEPPMPDLFPDKGSGPPAPALPPLKLHNGTYTVSHEEQGQHYTIKLHTAMRGRLAGRRIFSLLTGPSNEENYTGVAFWDEDEGIAHVWRKFASSTSRWRVDAYNWSRRWSKAQKKIAVLLSLKMRPGGGYWGGDGYEVLSEGRCVYCNLKLTTPESIKNGYGPVCARKHVS